ncbi:MAG: AAA family ATPase [Burkholderiaceae bacterium]|nr:AAA family ATPase [Burkholderiaceae bacterium]
MSPVTQESMPSAASGRAELDLEGQTRMVRALRERLRERHGGPVALIETHISFVLVCGRDAYKIKKALKTHFLDQSTLARRRRACDEELRLNRRLAADLYLGAVRITGAVDAPELDGSGADIDCAVHMRAFAQEGLWDRLAADGALQPSQVDELVRIVARFHDGAAVAPRGAAFAAPMRVRAAMLETLDDLERAMAGADERPMLSELRADEASAFARLRSVMSQRLARGRVRECHGDLHLGNVTSIEGRAVVFDGIEFSDELRWIDVISEVAFMAMDLHAHGLPTLAHRFVNGYLEASGDYDGLRLLRYYIVYRALVRAKVALLRASQSAAEADAQRAAARRNLALALRFSRSASGAAAPALLITHGLSGSGKSTLTQSLLEALGAIRVRADLERKRIAGLQALDRSGAGIGSALYRPTMTAAVYARLRRCAALALDAGFHVILDATFLHRAQRRAARRVAERRGLAFVILDFDVDAELLRQRVRQRAAAGGDPSDADEAVLAQQLRSAQPLQADERAAVHSCSAAASAPDGAARADWTPLLRRLAGTPAPLP